MNDIAGTRNGTDGFVNGHLTAADMDNRNGNGGEEARTRRRTSSPSGRSATPQSNMSDSTRRRIESDTIKEPSSRYWNV